MATQFNTKKYNNTGTIVLSEDEIGTGGMSINGGIVATGDDPVIYSDKITFPVKYIFDVGSESNTVTVLREYTYDELLAMGLDPAKLMTVASAILDVFEDIQHLIPEHQGKLTEI